MEMERLETKADINTVRSYFVEPQIADDVAVLSRPQDSPDFARFDLPSSGDRVTGFHLYRAVILADGKIYTLQDAMDQGLIDLFKLRPIT
jgi:hypothetical protein